MTDLHGQAMESADVELLSARRRVVGFCDSNGILAGKLHRADGEHVRALQAYDSQLHPRLADKQKAALRMRGFFTPRTGHRLKLRDWAVRLASIPVGRACAFPLVGSVRLEQSNVEPMRQPWRS